MYVAVNLSQVSGDTDKKILPHLTIRIDTNRSEEKVKNARAKENGKR